MRNVVLQMLVGYPLFLTSPIPNEGAEDGLLRGELYTHTERGIVIVCAGHLGYAFLKGALWCGQSTSVVTFIDVIDKQAEGIEQRLKAECPGLFEATDGNEFFRLLNYNVNSAQYLSNTEVAKRTCEALESCRLRNKTDCRPFIAVVVDDKELAESIWDIENSKSQSYDLVPVGDESVVCSYQNLFCLAWKT